MTDPLPTPSVEEMNKVAAPWLDDATHKKMRDDQEKLNYERMEEIAKHRPSPTVADMNAAAEGKLEDVKKVEKVIGPEVSTKEHSPGYKTRDTKAAR